MPRTKKANAVTTLTPATARVISGGKRPRRSRKEIASVPPPAAAPAPEPEVEQRHNDVRQRALLINLNIHSWKAATRDEEITDEVAQQHGIASDMGRYEKQLVSKAALEKLRSAAAKLRAAHKKYSLPWNEWGTRIMSSAVYPKASAELRGLIDDYEQVFCDELEAIGPTGQTKYEEHKQEAKSLLNGAWREEDYPTLAQLRSKYRATVTVRPIPAGDDFRIDLGAEATAQVRREIEEQAGKSIADAMNGLYRRVHTLVAKFVAALKSAKSADINKLLFNSLNTLLEEVPMLNVTGDAALETFAADIRALISNVEAKDLRESEPLRAETLVKADAILAKMNDFLG